MSMKKKAIFALLPFMAAGLATATIGLSTSPMMVEAADGEKEQLSAIAYNSAPDGIPYICVGEEPELAVAAEVGDIRVNWINDVKNVFNNPEADLAYRITAYDAGTEQTIDAISELDLSAPLFTFDFKENSFILGTTILDNLKAYIKDVNTDWDPTHFIGFTGQVVDLNGVYADGAVVTLGNSYNYLKLPSPEEKRGSELYIEADGSLNYPWLGDYDSNSISGAAVGELAYEFRVYDLGTEAVDGKDVIDPISMEPIVTFIFDQHAPIGGDYISDLLVSHHPSPDHYFGLAVRAIALNPTTKLDSSDWTVFTGSYQYGANIDNLFYSGIPAISSYYTAEADLNGLFDGNTAGGYQFNGDGAWAANVEKHVYLLIDLSYTCNVESLTISWERARAAEFDVYVGNPYLDWEELSTPTDDGNAVFEASLASDWKGIEPVTFTTGNEDANTTQTYEVNGTGRYILIDLKVPFLQYGYNVFEITGKGAAADYSYAYYALKNALDTTGCADFSNDSAKAKEFHAMLADLMGQLTEGDKAALRSVTPTYEYDESEDKTAYPQDYMALADYLLAKSEFYSGKTDSPAALVEKGESLNVALGAGLLVVSAAAAGAFFLLKKKKAN